MKNTVNHEYKSEKTYDRSHLDSAYAEDVRFEVGLRRAGTAHQDETQDDDSHADTQQDVVLFGKCQIIHYYM